MQIQKCRNTPRTKGNTFSTVPRCISLSNLTLAPPISDEQIKLVQNIVSTFVWYSRACDPILAASLSAIASRQTKGTEDVMTDCHQHLDYLATHLDASNRYHASDMILAFDTDASYLSELGGKSRAAAYYYMTNKGQK